jgi:hypothetical protein
MVGEANAQSSRHGCDPLLVPVLSYSPQMEILGNAPSCCFLQGRAGAFAIPPEWSARWELHPRTLAYQTSACTDSATCHQSARIRGGLVHPSRPMPNVQPRGVPLTPSAQFHQVPRVRSVIPSVTDWLLSQLAESPVSSCAGWESNPQNLASEASTFSISSPAQRSFEQGARAIASRISSSRGDLYPWSSRPKVSITALAFPRCRRRLTPRSLRDQRFKKVARPEGFKPSIAPVTGECFITQL